MFGRVSSSYNVCQKNSMSLTIKPANILFHSRQTRSRFENILINWTSVRLCVRLKRENSSVSTSTVASLSTFRHWHTTKSPSEVAISPWLPATLLSVVYGFASWHVMQEAEVDHKNPFYLRFSFSGLGFWIASDFRVSLDSSSAFRFILHMAGES